MKKIGLLIAIALLSLSLFAQEDGSTMEQPKKNPPHELPWKEENFGEFSEPVPLAYQRQSDVMYHVTIWRTIDLREKINHPLYFPVSPTGSWKSLAQVILDAIDSQGKGIENPLAVYNDELCQNVQTAESVRSTMNQVRTRPVFSEDGEEIGTESYDIAIEPSEILSYRIKEVWYFDKQRSALKVHILTVQPMLELVNEAQDMNEEDSMDDDMENVGANIRLMAVGYLLYDDLRPYLAKQSVFNVRNSAQKMSLDDLLTHKRMFASQIIAKENVYTNRQIQEYITNPRDQVIESDKIREEIRVKEHDLWEF